MPIADCGLRTTNYKVRAACCGNRSSRRLSAIRNPQSIDPFASQVKFPSATRGISFAALRGRVDFSHSHCSTYMHSRRSLKSVFVILVGGLVACGGQSRIEQQSAPPSRPLAGLAGQRVVVLPVHYLRGGDSLGWAARTGATREYLGGLDDEITFALKERGFQTAWAFPDEVTRTARRNSAYVPDPRSLAAESLRGVLRTEKERRVLDPLATQIRSLVGLHDARFALFPVEVRFEKTATGSGVAWLRVVIIDARASEVTWQADIMSDPSPTLSPALLASLAGHLADLIASP